MEPNGVLHGITRYRINQDQELVETRFIGRAIYQNNEWSLEDVRGSRLQDTQVETWREESGQWQIGLTPEVLSVIILKPEHLALSKLFDYANYLRGVPVGILAETGTASGNTWHGGDRGDVYLRPVATGQYGAAIDGRHWRRIAVSLRTAVLWTHESGV